MTKLVELSNTAHKDLKIATAAASNFISKQHIINLRADELGQAASSLPIFATRNTRTGFWMFSGMTSFALDNNLFVSDGMWQVPFQATSMLTHPIYLMQSPRDDKSYTFGILEGSEDFSTQQGEALFDSQGKASARLAQITQLLDDSVKRDIQTAEFSRVLEELGLFKELDMHVQFQDGTQERIKGLHTINEKSLQTISIEHLDTLRKQGYLMPIYAMLMSIYQVNVLIDKHNKAYPRQAIAQVKMDPS